MTSSNNQTKRAPGERGLSTKVFLGLLLAVGVLYGIILIYHANTPLPEPEQMTEASWLEQCRQLCAQYGLVTTGDIKQDAEVYLDRVDSHALSAPLAELLADTSFERAETEDFTLLGSPAPDFKLFNTENEEVSLADLNSKGPVILVFYYGYNCSHCVAQLFAIQKDLEYFHELGAEVVAVSADMPEHTREQYEEYGSFTFPVLSDPDYKVSEQWEVYFPPTEQDQDDLLHGTFVIDRHGKVIFANRGYQPFVDNKSLLFWLQEVDRATPNVSVSVSANPTVNAHLELVVAESD
ncbi:MAG: redoxin domain-containing protein [Planctomycetaceae bacterium]|nr:redoxin domain-containing protein [Planctomycetaceae bacterium]